MSAREFYEPGLAKTVTPAFFRVLCDMALRAEQAEREVERLRALLGAGGAA